MGPACWNHDKLLALLDAGMNVARLNFSHGDHAVSNLQPNKKEEEKTPVFSFLTVEIFTGRIFQVDCREIP